MIRELMVVDTLFLTQTVVSNIKGLSVNSFLNLRQTVHSNIIPLSVSHFLPLMPRVIVRSTIRSLSVQHTLNLSQSVTKGPPVQSVYDFLFLYQNIRTSPGCNVLNTLNLSQTVEVYKSNSVQSTLNLTQTISLQVIKWLFVDSKLHLDSTVNIYKPNKNFIPDPVVPVAHVLSIRYGTITITLRNAEFGNVERIEQNKIIRRSRGNDLIVYRDTMWPQWDTLVMTIMNLNDTQREQLLYLMNLSLGQIVEIFDHENVGFHAFCTSPAAQLSEQMQSRHMIQLEFQGVRL